MVSTRTERRVPWSAFEALPIFLVAMLLTAVIGVPLGLLLGSEASLWIAAVLAGHISLILAVGIWVRTVSHAPLAALGRPIRPGRDTLVGVGVGVLLLGAGAAVNIVLFSVVEVVLGRPPPDPQQIPTFVQGPHVALLAPVVVLGAPLAEETFYRGFLYQGLRNRLSVGASVTVSSVLFASVHVAGADFLMLLPALFVVGVGLALLYERRSSLLAPIVAHATFNLAGYIAIVLGRG